MNSVSSNNLSLKYKRFTPSDCKDKGIIFVLFYDVHKENMFTINLGDGCEAPSKARKKGAKRLEFLVSNIIIF